MHASSSAYCAFRPRLPLSTRQLCVGSIFEAAIFVVQNVKSQDKSSQLGQVNWVVFPALPVAAPAVLCRCMFLHPVV